MREKQRHPTHFTPLARTAHVVVNYRLDDPKGFSSKRIRQISGPSKARAGVADTTDTKRKRGSQFVRCRSDAGSFAQSLADRQCRRAAAFPAILRDAGYIVGGSWECRRARLLVMDSLSSYQSAGVRETIERPVPDYALASVFAGYQPDRTGLRQTEEAAPRWTENGSLVKSGNSESGLSVKLTLQHSCSSLAARGLGFGPVRPRIGRSAQLHLPDGCRLPTPTWPKRPECRHLPSWGTQGPRPVLRRGPA